MKLFTRLYRTNAIFALFITAIGFLLYAMTLITIIIFFVVAFAGQ